MKMFQKQFGKIFLLTISLILITLSFSNRADACVNCVPAPPGWGCGATSTGGTFCTTSNDKLNSCTVYGSCSSLTGCDFSPEPKLKMTKEKRIEVSDDLVREVGYISPRLAFTLMTIRNSQRDVELGTIHLPDVSLSSDDVERQLSPFTPKEYFDYYKKLTSDSFNQRKEPFVFNFLVQPYKNSFILTIESSDLRLQYPSIKIELKQNVGDELINLEAINWKIGQSNK